MNGADREVMSERISVLFVCLGNICRSPLAEGVFRKLVQQAGLEARFHIDSAGTSGYHDGETADARTITVAQRRGVIVDSISRKVTDRDVLRFDYIMAMDSDNSRKLQRIAERVQREVPIHRLRQFDPLSNGDLDVPDPWYGGESGFERVQDIIERSCAALLSHLRQTHGL
jgi:protein-tyrosine phosphatase